MGVVKKAALCASMGAFLVLTGCMTSQQYAAVQEVMKGSPALRPEIIDKCVSENRSTAEQKRLLAKLMNLKPGADVIRVGCIRTYDAVASGRITYRDFASSMSSSPSVEVIRVLQGR